MGVNVNKKILLPLCVLVAFAPGVEAACKPNIPQYSSARFQDNNDGTVTDTALKLMWMKCDLGARWDTRTKACVSNLNDSPKYSVQWGEALERTSKFNRPITSTTLDTATGGFVGKMDWRMPNVKELSSLLNYACLDGETIAIDPKIFPDASSDVWTNTPGIPAYIDKNATPKVIDSNTALVIEFQLGKIRAERIDNPALKHKIRLVRDATP